MEQSTKADIETIKVLIIPVKVRGLRIEAAREALRKNKEGEVQSAEVIDRLRAIRSELVELKTALGDLE